MRRTITVVILLVVLGTAGYVGRRAWGGRKAPVHDPQAPAVGASRVDVPANERAPAGVRVRVQVLNATTTRGLARRATFVLRDRGFDVVETGNAPDRMDSTVVIDRTGRPEWAARVARAMGGARVESRPDSSRYLDVTVLVGRSWTPPAEPFYP